MTQQSHGILYIVKIKISYVEKCKGARWLRRAGAELTHSYYKSHVRNVMSKQQEVSVRKEVMVQLEKH